MYDAPAQKENVPSDYTIRDKFILSDELLYNAQMKQEIIIKLGDIFDNFVDFYKKAYKTE